LLHRFGIRGEMRRRQGAAPASCLVVDWWSGGGGAVGGVRVKADKGDLWAGLKHCVFGLNCCVLGLLG